MDVGRDPRTIGITSTIPVEVVFAAGLAPVDLNNLFMTHGRRRSLVAAAEAAGFPLNFCAWIKGIYGACKHYSIQRVIGVVQGDCSNTHLLFEILEEEGVEVVPFEYPPGRDASRLKASIERLASTLGTDLASAEASRLQMQPLREKLETLDSMTWREGRVTGRENHLWLVNSSDMRGDRYRYETELDLFLAEAAGRPANHAPLRLGFLGIPPIVDDIYEALEQRGAQVVFNEFQRQFSMPGAHRCIVEQYLTYTYPYRTALRLADIKEETAKRKIDGHVHYVQSFCYRQLQHRAVKKAAGVPVLALEFDRPGRLDGRSITRIEAFIELLEARRLRAVKRGQEGS